MDKNTALSGLKVIELGNAVSAPFCSALLADFGADVIKIESPKGGDMIRGMGNFRNLWFAVENRNKKCVTLDLKHDAGKEILKKLLADADILVENFRPGALARLGFDWETIHKLYPRLIMVSISGYGQDGPYCKKAGFDRLGVAMGGLTYLTGMPDEEPLRPGLSIADYTTGAYGLIGAFMAIYNRDVIGTGIGQHIDVSLYESILRMNESNLVDYSYKGVIRQRNGNSHPSTIPGGNFLTKDGQYLVMACGGEKLFKLFATKIGRDDLIATYDTIEKRISGRADINRIAAEWISQHTMAECQQLFGDEVPNGAVYSVKEIFEDPQIKARGDLVTVDTDEFGPITMQGIYPRLSETPGEVRRVETKLGIDNQAVYGGQLEMTEEELSALKQQGVI